MRRLALLPLAFALASCGERQSAPTASRAPKPSKAPTAVTVGSSDSGPSSFILDTPRIKIRRGYQADITAPIEEAEAILKDIESLPKSGTRDHATGTVIEKMAETDPNRAREMLRGWTNALARAWGDTAGKVGIALARTNPGELEDFIGNEVPETMRTKVWSQALSQLPPTERFAYLELVPEGQDKMGMMADMIAAWLPQDPKAMAAWLDQFAAGREADELALLTQPRIYLDPAGNPIPASRAGDWLAALRSATTPEARAFLARQVLASSGDAPDAGILAELANADPNMAGLARDKMIQADAAGYAGNLSSQEIAALSSAEAEKVIGEWAKKQPRRALDWALEQDRPEAATALMALYYQEPGESIALVPTLKSGKERDAVIRSICALEAAGGKAETSRSLLALIGDSQQREAVRQNVERHLENAGKAGSQ